MTLNRVQESGSFAGNGTSQSITIGWQPAVIWIVNNKTTGTTANRAQCFKLASMPSAQYMSNNSNATYKTANGITLTSTGFSVGSNSDINDSGSTYYWHAIKAGPWLDTGTYSGTGATQSILLNRQPNFVMIAEDAASTDSTIWKSALQAGAATQRKTGSIAAGSSVTLTSTGFSPTSNASLSGSTYYYLALYSIVGATQHSQGGTYTGNGGAQSINVGFQPSYIRITDGTTNALKFPSMAAGSLGVLTGTHAWETAGCTITSTGFSLTSLSSINSNAAAYRYQAGKHQMFVDLPMKAGQAGKTVTGLAVTKTGAMTLEVAAGDLAVQKTGGVITLAAPQSHAFSSDPALIGKAFLGLITDGFDVDLWVDVYFDNGRKVQASPPSGYELVLDLCWFEIAAAETDLDNSTINRRVWE